EVAFGIDPIAGGRNDRRVVVRRWTRGDSIRVEIERPPGAAGKVGAVRATGRDKRPEIIVGILRAGPPAFDPDHQIEPCFWSVISSKATSIAIDARVVVR